MKEFKYVITSPVGIHARPAGLLVKEAANYASNIAIVNEEGKTADAKRIMAVMGLNVKQGQEITIRVEGSDEAEISQKIEKFIKENL